MKTGHWHVIGYVEPHKYVDDCVLHASSRFAPLGWREVYSADHLIILRNVESGDFNVLVDEGKGDNYWTLMIPANITTLRQWLTERADHYGFGREYVKEVLRNK